nr:DUF6796 family protein [uncultured Oscillibacter sp.]
MIQVRQKRGLRLGVLGMALCMAADWLLDVKPAGSVSDMVVESGWLEMSLWRFEASILIAAAIIPLFWLGIREMKALLRAKCQTAGDRRMSRLFDIGAMAGVISFLFIHIMCCFVAIIFKCAYAAGMDFAAAAALTNETAVYMYIPFFAYYFTADLSVSIAWVSFVLKGRLGLPKWAALCCPIAGLTLAELFHFVPWPVSQLGAAFETMGYVLLMAMGLRLCGKRYAG